MAAKKEEAAEVKEIVRYSAEDRVEIPPLFKDNERYTAPVVVIVNGKAYQIQRGVSGIKVPRAVAEILQQSEYQNQMATKYIQSVIGNKKIGEL